MVKIAYFISAYKEPESIIRLVNVLNRESDYFYVHFDKKTRSDSFEQWKELIEKGVNTKNIKITSEFNCKWATFGVVDATLSAMDFFEDKDYDYFINLTGECYPLKSTSQIREIIGGKNLAFLAFWKLPYKDWYQGGMNRINNRFFCLPKKGYPYVRIISIPRLRKRLPGNLAPYGGWSLFCFPKDIVSYVVDFTKRNPKFKSFFKRAHAPSEMYFQTILLNSPFVDRIVNDNKRYMDFKEAHPRTLTIADFEALKQSGCLFGRKFSVKTDREVLHRIDKEILGVN